MLTKPGRPVPSPRLDVLWAGACACVRTLSSSAWSLREAVGVCAVVGGRERSCVLRASVHVAHLLPCPEA